MKLSRQPMKPLTQLGEEIYRIKRQEKTTIEKMARIAGVTPQHLGMACRGTRSIRIERLQKIAEKFKKRLIIQFVEDYRQ